MVRRIFAPGLLFKARARRDVYLTSDYRFHSRFAARFEKRNSAIHCTVIGYRNGTVPRRGSGFRNISKRISTACPGSSLPRSTARP